MSLAIPTPPVVCTVPAAATPSDGVVPFTSNVVVTVAALNVAPPLIVA